MPVNYLEIQQQIPGFCENAKRRSETLGALKILARGLLQNSQDDLSLIHEKIAREARSNPNLRCAIPRELPLDKQVPAPNPMTTCVVLAADGSQIIPSRHRQVEFGAINLAAISMLPGSGQAPVRRVHSKLMDNADLADDGDTLTEGYIALVRDVSERQLVLETASEYPPPVVALTDGGLELFREPKASQEYDRMLAEYIQVLQRMSGSGIIPAGYVDKPGSSLVVKTLELMGKQNNPELDLGGLIDRFLFTELLNQPGSRSSIFAIQSPQSNIFSGNLAVHFFYLNVGTEANPKVARVEIPGWVAENSTMVDQLHLSLMEQCQMSGSPYPYLLHRAHEEAVIQYEDSQRLEEMLAARLLDHHQFPGEKSTKQSMKDLPGRKWDRR